MKADNIIVTENINKWSAVDAGNICNISYYIKYNNFRKVIIIIESDQKLQQEQNRNCQLTESV